MTQLRPVRSFLTTFGETTARPAAPTFAAPDFDVGGFADLSGDSQSAEPAFGLVDQSDEIRAELRAELEAGFEEKLAQEREAFDKERAEAAEKLTEARKTWAREEGVRLAASIKRNFDDNAQSMRDAVARLLTPFLTHKFLERSLSDFIDVLKNAAAEKDEPVIELHGPADLLEIVAERLSEDKIAVRTVETDTTDIAARIDNTLIESRMEEWVRRLRHGDDDQ